MIRRLLPFFLAIVAPLTGVALAFHFGTIDLGIEALSGMRAPQTIASLPPVEAEPEAQLPAWRAADAADAAVTPPPPAPAPAASPADPAPVTASPAAPPAPAAHNPNVRQATVATTVCKAGYTRRLRGSFASRYRAMLLASADVPKEDWRHWQLDHRVPLALGGAAREPSNLSLQPMTEARRKDRLEVKLQCLVCTGQVPLHVARGDVERDWRAAYHRYAKVKCKRPRKPRARPAT